MSDPYELLPNDLTASATGSVYFGNTSYSGADIKLVVHIYERGDTAKKQAKEYENDLQNATVSQSIVEGEIEDIKSKLDALHIGEPSHQRLVTKLAGKYQERDKYAAAVASLTDETARLYREANRGFNTLVLADAQTISISSHRDKQPVRSLGRVYSYGFVRGQRMIAGSIVFTVFNEHVLWKILEAHPNDFDSSSYTGALLDQLPPMDITIAFANEYGQTSRMAIYGVEFMNEGQTMSIEDILTENAVQWVARDFDPMRSVGERKFDESSRMMSEWASMKASDLILEDEYQNEKNMLDPFYRFNRRSNPFL